mmetsp:Transcript_20543/g.31390  ORF Transcript_20543/g.31390 Transcript_20543/m.31390 type:complete len:81 (+) Transcript_20543:179-421(+)
MMLQLLFILRLLLRVDSGEVWPTALIEKRNGEQVNIKRDIKIRASDMTTEEMLTTKEKSIVLRAAIDRFEMHMQRLFKRK